MDKQVYLSRQETESRKANGQIKTYVLEKMVDKDLAKQILSLKDAYYCTPALYGRMLANSPRHAHAKGRRVLRVTNF